MQHVSYWLQSQRSQLFSSLPLLQSDNLHHRLAGQYHQQLQGLQSSGFAELQNVQYVPFTEARFHPELLHLQLMVQCGQLSAEHSDKFAIRLCRTVVEAELFHGELSILEDGHQIVRHHLQMTLSRQENVGIRCSFFVLSDYSHFFQNFAAVIFRLIR